MNSQAKQIVPIILIVASFVLGYLSWEIYSEVPIVNGQITDYQTKNASLETTATSIETFADFVKENPDVIDDIKLALPEDDSKPNLVANFGNLAFLNGIMLKKISFSEPQEIQQVVVDPSQPAPPANDYQIQLIKMNFTGTYQAFKSFVSAIGINLKIMDISLIDFKPVVNNESDENNDKDQAAKDQAAQNQSANYEFELSIKTYYFKKTPEIKGGDPAILYRVEDLSKFDFTKGKQFSELSIPAGYNVDINDTGDYVNKNPF